MTKPAPPPMTARGFEQGKHEVHAHDHAVFVYDEPKELARGLAHFLGEGLAREELTIFVHGLASDEEALAFVDEARPGARRLHEDELMLVSLYQAAFESGAGRIDYEHVTGVVGSLVERARRRGQRGVRIFVDASRRYFEGKREKEWFAFEAWLGRSLQASAGLVCAYRRADATRPDLFPEILRTHAYRFDPPRRP